VESVHAESVPDVEVELEPQEAAITTNAKINNTFFICFGCEPKTRT